MPILTGAHTRIDVRGAAILGTGWVQFGPRYSLDFTIPLLLLIALGIRRWPTGLLPLLILISIIHYAIGSFYLGLYVS
jgi:hypothetical protein